MDFEIGENPAGGFPYGSYSRPADQGEFYARVEEDKFHDRWMILSWLEEDVILFNTRTYETIDINGSFVHDVRSKENAAKGLQETHTSDLSI